MAQNKKLDLKKLMQDRNEQLSSDKKIESPLAVYDDQQNLFCIVCKVKIENSALWSSHLTNKLHKSNLKLFKNKQLNKQQIFGEKQSKRKNNDNNDHIFNKSLKVDINSKTFKQEDQTMAIDSNEIENKSHIKSNLPEGFFDNPEEDAKARDEIFKDPVEEEWNKFQKSMEEEDQNFEFISEIEIKNTHKDRELYEIEEQFEYWKLVNKLEIKKEQKLNKNISENDGKDKSNNEDEETYENVEEELDIFSNWRKKGGKINENINKKTMA